MLIVANLSRHLFEQNHQAPPSRVSDEVEASTLMVMPHTGSWTGASLTATTGAAGARSPAT